MKGQKKMMDNLIKNILIIRKLFFNWLHCSSFHLVYLDFSCSIFIQDNFKLSYLKESWILTKVRITKIIKINKTCKTGEDRDKFRFKEVYRL